MEEGRNTATTKMIGSKKKYRSRSTSASSQDSFSSGSYSGKLSFPLERTDQKTSQKLNL
jgi:hypothetical protein